MENYQPPQNFSPAGNVIVNPAAELPFSVDNIPVENSGNPVTSGGVFAGLAEKENNLPECPEPQEEKVLDGTKHWRNLQEWVQQLIDQALESGTAQVAWEDISGRPGFLLEESDPTVPDYIKTLTESQIETLAWLESHFPKEGLTPGSVLIVGSNGETVTTKSFGEMLAVFFPGLTAVLTGIVSAPTTVTVIQQGYDIKIVWTDIERSAGYYAMEVRAKVGGAWGEWLLINQDDYTLKEHLWTQENIPAGTTDVGGRVRYINGQNQASAWTAGQTSYDADEEVINETLYEIVPGTVRWWQEDTTITPPQEEGETTYEIVAASVRWWSADSITPPDPAKPNPPVITVVRLNPNTIDVKVADTNSGKADTFEFNYREIGTNAWYTLKNDGTLNLSSASPMLVAQANNTNTWNLTMSLSNALFSGKKIESCVRTYVASVASDWSTIVQEPATITPGSRVTGVRTAKINIQKAGGLWSDVETDSEGGKLAYYYINGIPLKTTDGSRIKFENVSFRAGLLIEVSKVFLDSSFYDSWADYEENYWYSMIGSANQNKIGDYCQHNFKTY